MNYFFTLLFLLSSIGLVNAQTNILLNNGYPDSLVTHPGVGGAPDTSRLANQTKGHNTIGTGWQDLGSDANSILDEFNISNDCWKIDSILAIGYQTGSDTISTITGMHVQLWDSLPWQTSNAQVIYGDMATNRLQNTYWTRIYRDIETGIGATNRPQMACIATVGDTLTSGQYAVQLQATGALASGPWSPPINLGTTGNSRQFTGSDYALTSDLGTGEAYDVTYIIYGSSLQPKAVFTPNTDSLFCPYLSSHTSKVNITTSDPGHMWKLKYSSTMPDSTYYLTGTGSGTFDLPLAALTGDTMRITLDSLGVMGMPCVEWPADTAFAYRVSLADQPAVSFTATADSIFCPNEPNHISQINVTTTSPSHSWKLKYSSTNPTMTYYLTGTGSGNFSLPLAALTGNQMIVTLDSMGVTGLPCPHYPTATQKVNRAMVINLPSMGIIQNSDSIYCSDMPDHSVSFNLVTSDANHVWKLKYSTTNPSNTYYLNGTGSGFFKLDLPALTADMMTISLDSIGVTGFPCAGMDMGTFNVHRVDSPTGGTISGGNISITSGNNSGTLGLSGNGGNIVGWESSQDGGQTWVSTSNSSGTQSYNNLTTETHYRVKVESNAGECTAYSDTVVLSILVGRGSPNAILSQISLYPNPANNTATVALPTGSAVKSIRILDMYGRQVLQKTVGTEHKVELNIAQLAAGAYHVFITSDLGVVNLPLLKQ